MNPEQTGLPGLLVSRSLRIILVQRFTVTLQLQSVLRQVEVPTTEEQTKTTKNTYE